MNKVEVERGRHSGDRIGIPTRVYLDKYARQSKSSRSDYPRERLIRR